MTCHESAMHDKVRLRTGNGSRQTQKETDVVPLTQCALIVSAGLFTNNTNKLVHEQLFCWAAINSENYAGYF